MAKKMNPNRSPWFPFYTAAWLGSTTVINMPMADRGIYITLMAACWQYGEIEWDENVLSKLLAIDRRTIAKWMQTYGNLTVSLREASGDSLEVSGKRVLPKLQDFADTLRKNGGESGPEKRREEEKRRREEDTPSSGSVSKSKTTAKPKAFDPLTFDGDIVSSKSKNEYDGELVRKILLYHFQVRPKQRPDEEQFWAKQVISDVALARHIDTMYDQMVRDVGENWELPEESEDGEKEPVTRTVGDPTCLKCRGTGWGKPTYSPTGAGYRQKCECAREETKT